jgi:hypothetical protein
LPYSGGITLSRPGGRGRSLLRAGVLAAALLGVAGATATAAHAATTAIAVAGDSVLVTDPLTGATTVQATRPDAVTHKPVVIGQYQDFAFSFTPFSVNTTVPSPLKPNGDCWQAGALASALTPDLQVGDTVTATQTPLFGQPTSLSVPVTAADVKGAVGPIPACNTIAPFARNALTKSPKSVTGGPIAVSGVAQPFATHVSVSATDGHVSTTPVVVTPASSGTWSATIPAAQVDRLANGPVSVAPVFGVPDVSTGAASNIAAGPAAQVTKSGTGSSSPSAPAVTPSAPATPGGPAVPAVLRVHSLHAPSRTGIGYASRKGIRASFIVPPGANYVRVELKRGRKLLVQRVVPAGKVGSRQAVRLRGSNVRRVLRVGTFRIAVSAGSTVSKFGPRDVVSTVVH